MVGAIVQRTEEQHTKGDFTMVLRNINMFPTDDYRCGRTWELMKKLSTFVLKAPSITTGMTFDSVSDVVLLKRSER